MHADANISLNANGSHDILSDDILAAVLQAAAGITALLAHTLVVIFTFYSGAKKHQVSFVIASGSVAEAGCGFYLGVWQALAYGLQLPLGSVQLAFLGYIMFAGSNFTSFLLAVNRYYATCRTQTYDEVFSPSRTKIYLAIVWISAIICTIPYGVPGCRFFWLVSKYSMAYEDTLCGRVVAIGAEIFGIVAFVSAILNFITLRKLRSSTSNVSGMIENQKLKQRRQREVRFLAQSCVTTGSDILIVVCVDYLSLLAETKWSLFFLTSFVAAAAFAADGLVLLLLNNYLRESVMKVFCRRTQADESSDGINRPGISRFGGKFRIAPISQAVR